MRRSTKPDVTRRQSGTVMLRGRCLDVLERRPRTRKACNARAADCKFTVGALSIVGMQKGEVRRDPVHSEFEEWHEWSECSAKCGVGRRQRMRDIDEDVQSTCESPTSSPLQCRRVSADCLATSVSLSTPRHSTSIGALVLMIGIRCPRAVQQQPGSFVSCKQQR